MNDNSHTNSAVMVIPPFGKISAITLDMVKTTEAEKRFVEAKTVNPVTYVDLEHTFNEAYRELKRHNATVGYQIAMAEKFVKQAKGNALLDKYPDFMAGKHKNADNADNREAFLMRDEEYVSALDRLNQIKAIAEYVDGRIKVIENVCRYMRKEMDLILRSGMANKDLYLTHKK